MKKVDMWVLEPKELEALQTIAAIDCDNVNCPTCPFHRNDNVCIKMACDFLQSLLIDSGRTLDKEA